MSEKALYMLATILKSPVATETTLAIIETFAKVREATKGAPGAITGDFVICTIRKKR
jgi:hypothetical protein